MSDNKKSIGKKVLGWFVVDEDEPQGTSDASADELIAKYASEAPPPPPPPEVKLTGELPDWLEELMQSAQAQRFAFSKFVTSSEAVYAPK